MTTACHQIRSSESEVALAFYHHLILDIYSSRPTLRHDNINIILCFRRRLKVSVTLAHLCHEKSVDIRI